MRADDYIKIGVKRAVANRSWGRCQYFGCTEVAVEITDTKLVSLGQFAHILPVGDAGPRYEFKSRFPGVDLNSTDNIVLLCRKHHHLVDDLEPAAHPPERLFAMAAAKQRLLDEGVEAALLGAIEAEGDGFFWKNVRKLLSDATAVGPRLSLSYLASAERLLKDNDPNKFKVATSEAIDLVRLQICVLQVSNTYSAEYWSGALRRARALLARLADKPSLTTAVTLMMVFARDDFGVLKTTDRSETIRDLIALISAKIGPAGVANGIAANLLAVKAGLLRWQARVERGPAQAGHLLEAERCASLSVKIEWTPIGQLQRGLAAFARALALRPDHAGDYDREYAAAYADIMDPKLDDFAAAQKYRPRFLRDVYEFEAAERCFWSLVNSGYDFAMKAQAYVLCESTFSSIRYPDSPRPRLFLEAADYVREALQEGFDHGRNVVAWVVANATLDPAWFREQLLDKLPDGNEDRGEWSAVIGAAAARRMITANAVNQHLLFGIDDVEFWNMMARGCRIALDDPAAAIGLHQRAIRHAASSRKKFAAHVGLARSYRQLGDLRKAREEIQFAADLATAHQQTIITALRREIGSN